MTFLLQPDLGYIVLSRKIWIWFLVVIGLLALVPTPGHLFDVESRFIVNSTMNILNQARDSGYFTGGSAMWVTLIVSGVVWIISRLRDLSRKQQPYPGIVITKPSLDD